MIYVCSDWHLLHDKNFIYEPRGYSSVEEMTEDIIARHNAIVKPDDTVYVLGDCILGGKATVEHAQLLRRFNGNKYLAFGNHDTDNRLMWYNIEGIFKDIRMGYRIRYKHKEFILTHYPTLVGNWDDPKPIYNIHGHTHSSSKMGEAPKCYNVCMEATNNSPVLLDDIVDDINTAFPHK